MWKPCWDRAKNEWSGNTHVTNCREGTGGGKEILNSHESEPGEGSSIPEQVGRRDRAEKLGGDLGELGRRDEGKGRGG